MGLNPCGSFYLHKVIKTNNNIMSALKSIDKFTVLAEHLSVNGKKADPIIALIKQAEEVKCEHIMRGLIEWIVDNFDMAPNGGSIDFVYNVLVTLKRRRIAVFADNRGQFIEFVRKHIHDIHDNLNYISDVHDLRGKEWDGYYVLGSGQQSHHILQFLHIHEVNRIQLNFIKEI